jgi:hypothetical protein
MAHVIAGIFQDVDQQVRDVRFVFDEENLFRVHGLRQDAFTTGATMRVHLDSP